MKQFDVVPNWLNSVSYAHSQSKATEEQYKRVWKRFAGYIGKTAEKILAEYDASDDRIFRKKYAHYIRAWIADSAKEGLGITSIKVMVGAVKSFFKYNDLPQGLIPQAMSGIMFVKDVTKEEINRLDEEDDLEAELGPKKSAEEAATAVRNNVRADDKLE